MNYRDKKLGRFLDARDRAGKILQEEGVLGHDHISLDQALYMQIGAELLKQRPEGFYGYQLMRITGDSSARVYQTTHRFEEKYTIVKSTKEASSAGPARRVYLPTELGSRVFGLFI